MIVEAFNVLNISGKFIVCVEADDTITAGVDGINTRCYTQVLIKVYSTLTFGR